MKKIQLSAISPLVIFLVVAGTRAASTLVTYEDLAGLFLIDLPKDHQLAKEAGTPVGGKFYQFKMGGPDILLFFEGDQEDWSKAGDFLASTLTSQLKDPKALGNNIVSEVNGNRAQLMVYKGSVRVEGPGVAVDMFAMSGKVRIKKGTLSFGSIYRTKQKNEWENILQESFMSIRDLGVAVQPTKKVSRQENNTQINSQSRENENSNRTPVLTTLSGAPATAASVTAYDKNSVHLRLPAGWAEEPLPANSPKELRAVFAKSSSPGTTLRVMCLGSFVSRESLPAIMSGALKSECQDARLITGPLEVETAGRNAVYEVYSGNMIIEGRKVPATGFVAWKMPTGFGCKYGIFGFTIEQKPEPLDQIINDFTAIIQSLK